MSDQDNGQVFTLQRPTNDDPKAWKAAGAELQHAVFNNEANLVGQVEASFGISLSSLGLHSPITSWEDFRSLPRMHSCLVSCHFTGVGFSQVLVRKQIYTTH